MLHAAVRRRGPVVAGAILGGGLVAFGAGAGVPTGTAP